MMKIIELYFAVCGEFLHLVQVYERLVWKGRYRGSRWRIFSDTGDSCLQLVSDPYVLKTSYIPFMQHRCWLWNYSQALHITSSVFGMCLRKMVLIKLYIWIILSHLALTNICQQLFCYVVSSDKTLLFCARNLHCRQKTESLWWLLKVYGRSHSGKLSLQNLWELLSLSFLVLVQQLAGPQQTAPSQQT